MPSTDSLLLVPARQVNHPVTGRRDSGGQESPADSGFGGVLASQSSSHSHAQSDSAQEGNGVKDDVAQKNESMETVASGNGLPQQGNALPQDTESASGEQPTAEGQGPVLAEPESAEQAALPVVKSSSVGDTEETLAGTDASDEVVDSVSLQGLLPGNADPRFSSKAAAALADHKPEFPAQAAAGDKFPQGLPPGQQLTATMAASNGVAVAEPATSASSSTLPTDADTAALSAQQDMPTEELLPLDADAATEDIIEFKKDMLSAGRELGGQNSVSQGILARTAGQGMAADSATGLARASQGGALTNHMGTTSWNHEVAGRLTVMINNHTEQATLKLNPPELGRMDIKISTDGDRTNIHFVVDNGMAKDALEAAMPRLRHLMEMGGLQLAQAQVSQHSGGQSHSQAQSQLPQQGSGQEASAIASMTTDSGVDVELTDDYLPPGFSSGRIDYYI